MYEPPAAPTTSLTLPSGLVKMEGHIEDNGRLPLNIKFAGEGGIPKIFVMFGDEKSSISSLNMIPVRDPLLLDPNL